MPWLHILAPLASLCLAAQANEDQRWAPFTHPNWEAKGVGPVNQSMIVVILVLKQRNLELLEKRAMEVSDPDSPSYGKYFSSDQVHELIRPSSQHVSAVRDFLASTKGVVQWSSAQDKARFVCDVKCVEQTFGTTLKRHKGPQRAQHSPYRAATPIHLPPSVAEALDGVSLNAPIFVPAQPPRAPTSSFVYPAKGRKAPRINPRLFSSGDGFLSVRFVPYCQDGKANTDSLEDGLCKSGGSDGGVISLFQVEVLQGSRQKVVSLPTIADMFGQRAAEVDDKGASAIELDTIIENIENFHKTTARIRAWYSDGTVTPFSDPAELPGVWPLPYTTPALLSELYGTSINAPIRDPRNIISVAEFLGEFYSPNDLETFFHFMSVRSWGGAGRTQPKILGPNLPDAGSVMGGEAQLDIQYIMAMAANVTTWFWSVPGKELATQEEPFLDWLMQVSEASDSISPLVHSVSYGDQEKPMPRWFKDRVNVEFMKLALRGVSVLIASGDDGAAGSPARTNSSYCKQANPEFPGSSPWVTAVGGTQLSNQHLPVCAYSSESVVVSCHDHGEVVASAATGGAITSGGGFSTDFPIPWYQKDVVEAYLKQQDSPVPDRQVWDYNPAGRGYPDISALASNYLVWMGDHFQPTSGTSASTPLVAAIIAQLNEQRLQHGLPPLGFLNPLLYKLGREHPEAFKDITMGDNRCACGPCCDTGFGAARGWDAVTGFGSLNVDVLVELVRPDPVTHPLLKPTTFAQVLESESDQSPWAALQARGLLAVVPLTAFSAVAMFALGARATSWLT